MGRKNKKTKVDNETLACLVGSINIFDVRIDDPRAFAT